MLITDYHRVVKAVMHYAYTGSVELTFGRAQCILLLALNLQCRRIAAIWSYSSSHSSCCHGFMTKDAPSLKTGNAGA